MITQRPFDVAMERALGEFTERLHIAALTMLSMPGDGPRGLYSTWPTYRLEYSDWFEFGEARTDKAVTAGLCRPPVFYPTARQIDECEPMLSLLQGISSKHHRIVALRAQQQWYDIDGGWRRVGRWANCAHKTARKLHIQAVGYAFRRSVELRSLKK